MSRWAVLYISSAGNDWVSIKATESISLEWIRQLFPKAHFEEDADMRAAGCWGCRVSGLGKMWDTMIWRIEKYLGQTGWEPFADFQNTLKWRKLMTD